MTDQAERYDWIAAGYAQWWAPILAPAVHTLLDELDGTIAGRERIVDIGTGTGQLALGALLRWPDAAVVGIDASSGMCAVADAEADRLLDGGGRGRFSTAVAFADELPFPDGAFDLAISSFVLQLVPRRARALREARRVLRPDGILSYVSWLEDARTFPPDETFDDVLDDVGIGAREGGGRSGDLPSVEIAAGELRHAGFAGVEAHAGHIEHRFTVDGYVAFLTKFDEETLFDELEPELRERTIDELRRRLARLSPAQMTLRYPIVYATGRRSRRA